MKLILLIFVILAAMLLSACTTPAVTHAPAPTPTVTVTAAPKPAPTVTVTKTVTTTAPTPTPPAPLAPARFVLGDLTITPTTVNLGEAVTVSIPVSNTGGIEGSYTVVFKKRATWTTWENVEVTLKPGETKMVTYTTKGLSSPGSYTVDVNGKVGQFIVTAPLPTPTPTPEPIIKDLAYIKASAWSYSDDADPEYEGISIYVDYYNSKSEGVEPNGVSVEVTVELYWYTNYPPIYQKRFIVEYPAYVESSGYIQIPKFRELLRIPFDGIQGRPSGWSRYRNPILDVVVATPKQGSFEDRGVTLFYWP